MVFFRQEEEEGAKKYFFVIEWQKFLFCSSVHVFMLCIDGDDDDGDVR